MSAIPVLKKKLKGIRATEKLSKALKTVSAAKFSKLFQMWKNYSLYASQYADLFALQESSLPCGAVVVLGSNHGFCGAFNIETVNFLEEKYNGKTLPYLVSCGEKFTGYLNAHGFKPDRVFAFGDIPSYNECTELFSLLSEIAKSGKSIEVIYPKYKNTVTQIPDLLTVNYSNTDLNAGGDILFIPNKACVADKLSEKSFCVPIYGAVLETALGTQAATLMTMRSAYDTAREFAENTENKIHRLRQTEVTADVLETSSELHIKGDDEVVG